MNYVKAKEGLGLAEQMLTKKSDGMLAGHRILVYGMNFAPEFAGVGKYTAEVTFHYNAEGADVLVVTTPPHYPGWKIQSDYKNWYQSNYERSIKVIRCPLLLRRNMRGLWRLFAPITFALTSAPVVFWSMITHRPSVVFLVEPTLFAAPLSILLAKLVGARTVLHVQDLEVDAAFAVGHISAKALPKRLAHAFERYCLKYVDQVITISNRMEDKLADKGVNRARMTVIRNWVDLDDIYPLNRPSEYRAALGYKPEDFIVLYSGNIGPKQGLHVLLDAATILKDIENIKFIVAGEGPSKQDLERNYSHLKNLRFLPFQPQEKFNEFMALADLHALIQEANAADLVLPSKLASMLASGKPIVVTTTGETELATFVSGTAVMVEPGSAQKLADAIVKTKQEHSKRPTEVVAERMKTLENFSRERSLSKITILTQRVILD